MPGERALPRSEAPGWLDSGPSATLFACDEPGVNEELHLVGDNRLGEADDLGEVAQARLPRGRGRDQGVEPRLVISLMH